MKGMSESLIAIIIIVIGIVLGALFIGWYLHQGGNMANSLWNATPNVTGFS